MASYMNFKNIADTPQPESNGGKSSMGNGDFPLARQSSIYSLTFDELQTTFSGLGKDFGSINMEDLLKSIWTAEESQAVASSTGGGDGNAPVGNLQRQGSFTLPRPLRQKSVDEVWRNLQKETASTQDGSGTGNKNFGQRQSTLGEMTLEEFLVKAGVVREDIQSTSNSSDITFNNGLSQQNNNNGLNIAFQQPTQNTGLLINQIAASTMLNVVGATASQQQPQQQQPLFPKQTTVAFASPMQLSNNGHLASPRTKAPAVGMSSPPVNTNMAQGGVMGMAAFHSGVSPANGGSPGNDFAARSSVDTSSLSPSPYAFNEGGGRGRRSGSSLEKVVERRRRRMIKNRESAARSRARKQAYTLELEAEVTKLKEINEELRKKQTEIIEKQKNQLLDKRNMSCGYKLRCLRRTLTGPW
ncbi:unnamed protein product [Withania somnifera]